MMKNSIKIAFRNVFRNRRRTLFSVLIIAMGGVVSLLLGSFVSSIYYGMQTGIVRGSGHLHIHKKGFFKYGVAKTGQYDIENYQKIIDEIKNSTLASEINVITPVLSVSGIVSNSYKNSSQTFIGIGMVANDQQKMQVWDGFGLNIAPDEISLESLKEQKGLIGKGLAINLGLCEALNLKGCLAVKEDTNTQVDADIKSFSIVNNNTDRAVVDLMVAPATGAPNIVSIPIAKVWEKEQKNLDDRFLALPLHIAQSLLYGSGDKKVNSIILQLKKSESLESIKQKLEDFFVSKGWDLEIITLPEFFPQFSKVLGMFGFIFGFVSLIIAIIILFAVSNTMTMSVMERYKEIGTLRAMGLKRSGVREYFILEGTIIGILGATIGLILAFIITTLINNSGVTWSPPSGSGEKLLILQLTQNPMLLVGVWFLLVLVSIFSSFFPANKASKMHIVDALRYN